MPAPSGLPSPSRLTVSDVACWVIKSRTAPTELLPGWRPGEPRPVTRCLRRSYRLDLMAAGQPCLLWLSGPRGAGVQAIGTLAGEPEPRVQADAVGREMEVAVQLQLLGEPVPRTALLADPVARAAEVLRMPAGSNPSYLSPTVWSALCEHIDPAELDRAGW